jgi:signal transduction histidine kinase
VAVVVLLQPVRRVAVRVADRLVYGPRAARYAVLVAHSDQLADAAAGTSFLAAVAETTARLMGASSCRAGVRLDDGSEVSEAWPPGTIGPGGPGEGALEVTVRSGGVDVGRLVLEQRQQAGPSASRRRVLREFCERAGPAFATTGLEESLRAGATRLARVNAELAASRQRLLAADDSGRRQVAAAIRVGVVSGLREVSDRLSAVTAATRADPPGAVGLVDACIATTTDALEELREITRAISPPLLAQRGLSAALRARGGRVHVDDRGATHRWPEDVEAAAWFCCTELLRGARGDVRVALGSDADGLVVTLTFEPDDGPGGAQLEGAADRVEALGGTLERHGRDVRMTFPVSSQERPGRPLPLPTRG